MTHGPNCQLAPNCKRLRDLILRCINCASSEADRHEAGRQLNREFFPEECSAELADILNGADLCDDGRLLVIRILYVVGDDEAVRGMSTLIGDARRSLFLRTEAARLLSRIDLETAAEAVKTGAPFLLPLIEAERIRPTKPAADEGATDRIIAVLQGVSID